MNTKKILEFNFGFLIFYFCFFPKSIAIFIIVAIALFISAIIKKEVLFHPNKLAFSFILLYLCYVIGLIYSSNLDLGFKYLEYKLLFLLIPTMFFFRFKDGFNKKPVYIGLILGLIVASLLGVWNSYLVYLKTLDFNNAFGSVNFSYIHHPSYFSFFLLISLVMFYEGYKRKWKFFNTYTITLYTSVILITTFFCFSFAGLLSLFFLIIFFALRKIYTLKRKIYFYLILACFPLLIIGVYQSNIHIKISVDELISSLKKVIQNPKKKLMFEDQLLSGNDSRIVMWVVSFEEILKNPFGVGTGDVDLALSKRLKAYNLNQIAGLNYNPHNQFLQTCLEIGFLALLIFVLIFYYLISFALKNKDWVLISLGVFFFFNCLFESMLQRESGIVFFTFLTIVLTSSYSLNSKFENENTDLNTILSA